MIPDELKDYDALAELEAWRSASVPDLRRHYSLSTDPVIYGVFSCRLSWFNPEREARLAITQCGTSPQMAVCFALREFYGDMPAKIEGARVGARAAEG